ncbi:hypothetical protein BD769DRAFT_1629343 [Suillus cothurnatus]|nr:hypothetical protein BD769DRAFT_1629343 [Suillus cothurnatus]
MYIDLVLLTLIYHGYIGCAPVYPTVAISLRILAAYHQTHRVCPSFALCFLHSVSTLPYLTAQLSSAFDVYLEILHRVDQRLHTALKRDTPNWHLLNSCPACFYKLEDEPNLEFKWLISIDGNNSLKRWDSTTYGTNVQLDSRKACSDFWIATESVDKFSSKLRAQVAEDNNIASTLVETNPAPFSCANWWKNAGPETHKKMFSVFDESGIFIAACCHQLVLVACDMIRSGELAKYPLSIIDKLLMVYGKNGACAFTKTLGTSTLGPQAQELGFHLMVGAFHGHAHNRMCQLDWHPMYITGTGYSKGEGYEHIFSASNALARGTQHASKFHWHQMIEQHFAFWNDNKYANLNNFLWNHYCEALKSIETLTVKLSTIKSELNITDNDFLCYFEQEHTYLHSLKEPPARDQICICYVEALDELTERRRLMKRSHKLKSELIHHMQSGPEYNGFKMEACISKYHAALDELERLVVMRLFELSKLSLSGTGYKLRQQISKALQRRSEAIRNAINQYNMQAVALIPPRPRISWKDIVDYSFLGEFDLLRHSWANICSNDWAKPAHREATNKFFKLRHTHKEVEQLNIEELQTSAIIDDLLLSDPRLAAELQRQCCPHAAINAIHCYHLDCIEHLAGFLGIRDISTLQNVDNIDVIDCEEHSTAAEDMADFFHSIID